MRRKRLQPLGKTRQEAVEAALIGLSAAGGAAPYRVYVDFRTWRCMERRGFVALDVSSRGYWDATLLPAGRGVLERLAA